MSKPKPKVTMAAVIKAYIATRNQIAELKKEFDAEVAGLKEVQSKREKWIQENLDRLGADSSATEYGTAYKKVDTAVRVQDWPAFREWAQENGYESMFKRDVAKTEVVDYYEEHKELPPGLAMERVMKINVRVANSRTKKEADDE